MHLGTEEISVGLPTPDQLRQRIDNRSQLDTLCKYVPGLLFPIAVGTIPSGTSIAGLVLEEALWAERELQALSRYTLSFRSGSVELSGWTGRKDRG